MDGSNVITTNMVPVCYFLASILFGPGFSYSYMSTYFTFGIDIMCEPFAKPIYVYTPVGELLVVNRVYEGLCCDFYTERYCGGLDIF